jgi:virginiamycin A acetyltransferase
MNYFRRKIKKWYLSRQWRKMNRHNLTCMVDTFDSSLVSVGNASYGTINVINHSVNYKLSIGHYCSIGPDVLFVVCGDHRMDTVSTYPFMVRYLGEKYEATSKGDIIVGDDVWIGTRVTILSGVKIGQGAVICAGAIVNRDVPPYAIVGGTPAKVIRKRFDEDKIKKLLQIDYSNLTPETIKSNKDIFCEPFDDVTKLEHLPRRDNYL